MMESVQVVEQEEVNKMNTTVPGLFSDVKTYIPTDLKLEDIQYVVDDGTGGPQFDVEGKPSFKSIHEDAEAIRCLLFFKTNKDYSIEIYNHYVNQYKMLAARYTEVLEAQRKLFKKDAEKSYQKLELATRQSVRKSTKKSPASDELKNKNKKFAKMMKSENRPIAKELHLVKNLAEEDKKENVCPIDLTVKSPEIKEEQNQLNLEEISESMFRHNYNLKSRKNQQSTPKNKKSLLDVTYTVSGALPRIPYPDNKKFIANYLPLLPILDGTQPNDHTYAKYYMKRARGNSLDSGIVFPEMTEKLQNLRAMSMPRLNINTTLSGVVQAEFQRLRNASDYCKEYYVSTKLKENPINTDYNPNKARKRLTDLDEKLAEAREKNNLASRLSRHKKKVRQQRSGYAVEFYTKECLTLGRIRNWIEKTKNLAEKLLENQGKTTESIKEKLDQDCNATV